MEPDGTGTTLTESWELLEPQPFIDVFGPDVPVERASVVEADLVATPSKLRANFDPST